MKKIKEDGFSRFFSKFATQMKPNYLRKMMSAAENDPEMILLTGGLPHPEVFPIGNRMEIEVKKISSPWLNENVDSKDEVSTATSGSECEATGQSENRTCNQISTIKTTEVNLDTWYALQYNGVSYSNGIPRVLSLCRKLLIEDEHGIRDDDEFFGSCLSCGNTDGLMKAVDLLTNEGDYILCGEFTYPAAMTSSFAKGRHLAEVEMDEQGMFPESLRKTVQKLRSEGKTVKFVYIIPTAQNPTTTTMPLNRREKIYKVCREEDLVLVEDDPYYFLKLDENEQKVKSFIAIDRESSYEDGLVIRLDTFSKTVFPGSRLGIVTGPKSYIKKFAMLTQISNWGISGPNQTVIYGLLNQMGASGFKQHIEKLCTIYRRRRDWLYEAIGTELEAHGILEGEDYVLLKPSYGMFLWVEFPKWKGEKIEDVVQILMKNKVSVAPAVGFSPSGFSKKMAFRLSFSYLSDVELSNGAKVFAKSIAQVKGVEIAK
eukprot:maker-scaffold_63-snap-gene-0.14-mRNA-1 protein AED:0.00 eAED:0.00 QI:266/1/1/1/1/1/2/372/485